jgi:hypothetical protein
MPKLMPSGQSCRILSAYAAAQNLSVSAISLDDYLDTAAVCYRSAFKRAKSLSPEQMYRRWADRRDAGMLSVKPRRSAAAFSEWLAHASGGHPFEIVFSWIEHGIHLYPPRKEALHYTLALTNYDFAGVFAAMVKALIKEEVAFRASGLEDVLRFLRGESYFRVNEHDDNTFFYVPSMEHRRDYFPHIEWDGLKLPVWR